MADAWGGSWGTPSAWAESWAAGATATAGGGFVRRRRRYIMPDGQTILATTDEAVTLLQRYCVPQAPELRPAAQAKRIIAAPRIVLERRDIRFVPAQDSLADTWQAVVSERFAYRPPPGATRQAEILANRMRADDEALIALLM